MHGNVGRPEGDENKDRRGRRRRDGCHGRNVRVVRCVVTVAGVLVSPGLTHCLRGIPFGWSHVEPFRREATGMSARRDGPRLLAGAIIASAPIGTPP